LIFKGRIQYQVLAVVFLVMLTLISSCTRDGGEKLLQETYVRLDGVRDRERASITKHFNALGQAAKSITDDELMMKYFYQLKDFNDTAMGKSSFGNNKSQILDSHFVHSYGSFYDILFVDNNGFVFHSIKQEADHLSNLLTGELAQTLLATKLKNNSKVEFVDFEPYGPSGEAAAFFVAPVFLDGVADGWFILQYGTNELNAMLTNREDLGRSGEVYLVNQNYLMLSDSKFINNSTVLMVAANTDPVNMAFKRGSGHTLSQDYRGVDVISSYTKLDVLGVNWAIIVEIDADEIISDYYQKNRTKLPGEIILQAKEKCKNLPALGPLREPLPTDARVDVNELRRVSDGETCWTPGVGPCTALVAYRPGNFGYLLHLGPTDDVYCDDPLTRIFLGTKRTSLVENLLFRIAQFDVVYNDLGLMRFVIVATHTNSFDGIITALLAKGIYLSQIQFAYNPTADYANVHYNQAVDTVEVQWSNVEVNSTRLVDVSQVDNVSEYLNVFDD